MAKKKLRWSAYVDTYVPLQKFKFYVLLDAIRFLIISFLSSVSVIPHKKREKKKTQVTMNTYGMFKFSANLFNSTIFESQPSLTDS